MGKSEIHSLFRSIPVILTIILATVTIISAFSGNFDPANSKYMPVLGLALPVLLICNLLVAICWAFARSRWILIPFAALAFNYGYILSVFQFNFTKKIPEGHYSSNYADGYLKVATYNVGNFGTEITGYSCKEIARYMKQQEVDVLCFQEFGDNQHFPMDSIRNVFSHWRYALIPTEDSISGVLPIAIFSRYPLINPRFISYPQSANCSMQCDIILGRDTVRLLNNHLQTTSVNQNRRKWERGLNNTNDTGQGCIVRALVRSTRCYQHFTRQLCEACRTDRQYPSAGPCQSLLRSSVRRLQLFAVFLHLCGIK